MAAKFFNLKSKLKDSPRLSEGEDELGDSNNEVIDDTPDQSPQIRRKVRSNKLLSTSDEDEEESPSSMRTSNKKQILQDDSINNSFRSPQVNSFLNYASFRNSQLLCHAAQLLVIFQSLTIVAPWHGLAFSDSVSNYS